MVTDEHLHNSGLIIGSRGEEWKNPHKRVTLERAESTLPVIALDVCFIKTSGIVSGVVADEGATCLALVDADTGHLKAVPAAAKTATDYSLEGGRRFVEQFFRRRVRSRCCEEPATVALAWKLKGLLPGLIVLGRTPRHDSPPNPAERAIKTLEEQIKRCGRTLRNALEPGSWQTSVCGCG